MVITAEALGLVILVEEQGLYILDQSGIIE
jgi:hypothetical protein